MSTGWNFDNTYTHLPEKFYSAVNPFPAENPEFVLLNHRLAKKLGLDFSGIEDSEIAAIFSGAHLPQGANPISQAYAGHQFGHFTMLGDGRAIVIGEQIAPNGKRFDIQFKGSGRTPYSRSGDGRATLYSMLREYLISEALHHLGIPTTGSLAVVKTGLPVFRETMHPGAVLTRVASSHIRIGTFEYAARFLSLDDLQELLNYTIDRHYPDLHDSENPALGLLQRVSETLLQLVIKWMRVGFIHGVLNTDNMCISGESIDFGPCAFMNHFNPSTAFSSVDVNKRYAFSNQPGIIQWNLAVFAGTLLPFIDTDEQKAREAAEAIVQQFKPQFVEKWHVMMGKKLGFRNMGKDEAEIIERVIDWMEKTEADYTNTFLALAKPDEVPDTFRTDGGFMKLHGDWKSLIEQKHGGLDKALKLMHKSNPVIIPRNHLVEEALEMASNNDDYTSFHSLLTQLQSPYKKDWVKEQLQKVPAGFDQEYRTFCGT